MTRSLRAVLAVVAACAFLAGPPALAETKPAGPTKPSTKGAPPPKPSGWYVPDMDGDWSPMMKGKGGPKSPSAATGSGRR